MAPVRGAGVVGLACVLPCSTVMRGLDPRISLRGHGGEIPGSSPGMTVRGSAGVAVRTRPLFRSASLPGALLLSASSPRKRGSSNRRRLLGVRSCHSFATRWLLDSRLRGNDGVCGGHDGDGPNRSRATSHTHPVVRGLDPRISAVTHTRIIASSVSRSPSRDPGRFGTAGVYGTGPRLGGRGTSCLRTVGGHGREIPGSSPGMTGKGRPGTTNAWTGTTNEVSYCEGRRP